MCYSAMVNMHVKELGLTYKARVQIDMFEDLFRERLAASASAVNNPRPLEAAFLEKPKSAPEMRIAKSIREFQARERKALAAEIKAQSKRLAAAEKALAGKVTKKAQNDQRIATSKIEKAEFRLGLLESGKISESDSRIWPGSYAPLIVETEGERSVRPFRYLLRPFGQSAAFDRKFEGSYNARRDRLEEVFWWKSVYGKRHGILPIHAFFEHVKVKGKNVVLRFEPKAFTEMAVPCIWDRNEAEDFTLHSFALITDDPNPEVAAAGHDRTPVVMRPKYIDLWLGAAAKDLAEYAVVFDDKQPTYFEHEVAA
ncbi:MAG: SOS response-associated peptidase family protein [Bdellovibrionales bacterium]|nr:SOS response-associated peptidase family protein [Bdellovibrionales bacterium]